MFPSVTRIEAGKDHPGRDSLFKQVDHFRFVDHDHASLIVKSVSIGSVTVATVRSVGHDISLNEVGCATFLCPLKGTLGVETRGASLAVDSGGAMLVRTGRRNTAVRANGEDHFLAAVALAPAQGPNPMATSQALSFPDAATTAASAFHEYLAYFVRHYQRPDSPLRRVDALRASEAVFLDLFAALDASDSDPDTIQPVPAEARVRTAEEFMRAQTDEPLTVATVAQAVGVGPRALQAAFREYRGTSPRAVLASFRLDRARDRLLAAPSTATVSDIALMTGFVHLGRFAAAYRARFGEFPSDTLQRSRQ